jgi:tRNA-modifying protein YgfZ
MTLPDHHLDDPVPAHHGDPFAEQRAMARQAAVVDRSHRGVIAVTGPDRLDWLHLLITQHVSALPEGGATEALVLDGQGRVLHHMAVAQVDDVVYLDVEAAELAELLAYLQKMVFWSKVEPRDATAELAVLSLVGPEAQAVLAALDVPVPEGAAPLEGGGYVRRTRGPGLVDLVVPRAAKAQWWQRITGAGARPAGTVAYEALRVAAVLPRAGLDTDDRTIPHEVGWIGGPGVGAVHLEKGCYRGQETVARVHNLGKPPRMLVLVQLDGSQDRPGTGDPLLAGGRPVGRLGSVVDHVDEGPIALALVKRGIPADTELVTGGEIEVAAVIDADSVPDTGGVGAGRLAVEKLRGGGR